MDSVGQMEKQLETALTAGSVHRGLVVLPLVGFLLILPACCCGPEEDGRCGMPGICDPVVMHDPLAADRCVPPKGVDTGHYGYVRTSWRVLSPRDPDCCEGMIPGCHEELVPEFESVPLDSPVPAPVEDTESGLIDQRAASNAKSAANLPSYLREPFPVRRYARLDAEPNLR